MTGNVVQTILGPTCTHVATGKNPLPVNESVVEMMQCSNVPAGATFKIKTIKDGVPLVDTPFSLVGGRFSQTFTNTGVPDLVGSWRRHIEMYSLTGALLTSTLDFTFVFLTPSCSYTVTATDPVAAGGMAIETAVCSMLPTGAVVKLYGTVNGTEQVNQAISLVSGKYSQTYTNPGGATLLFRRRVEVYSPTSQLILATPYVEITFGP